MIGRKRLSDDVIDEIADLGPHFAMEISDPDSGDGNNSSNNGDPWQPIGALIDGSATLLTRYRQVQDALTAMSGAPVELRVAASVGHLGLVARLVCPAFGAALLGYRLDLTGVRWQPVVGGILPLSVPRSALTPGIGTTQIVGAPIIDLLDRTNGLSVSRKVLWGNVFSAVNGAANTVSSIRPDLADRARALAGEVLAGSPLRDTFVGTPGRDGRRRSCCLIYRIAPPNSGSYCGDCILAVN
ncbi:hypothetical protein ABIB25_002928 [Nakamurella sp. UYEF19]|uniref:hypothetical protein n=1 Tax=Nakamurella sp. UYEF19 TaxID=1756392 RepID=UPI00339897A7